MEFKSSRYNCNVWMIKYPSGNGYDYIDTSCLKNLVKKLCKKGTVHHVVGDEKTTITMVLNKNL